MKQSEENTNQCKKLKNELDKINREISKNEKEIENIKKDRNALDNNRRQVRVDLKNKMTEFGVSLDFITDALVPSRFTAILKAGSDAVGAPSAFEIEHLIKQVSKMEKEIESKEKDIMRKSQKIRPLVQKRDKFVREWRFSRCGKASFRQSSTFSL